MRIAFLGGTGFIGPVAVRSAIARDHEVAVLHRGEHTNPNADAQDILVDRTDVDALTSAVQQFGPDVVVDMRAMTRSHAETMRAAWAGPAVVLSSQDVYAQFGRLLDHPGPEPEAVITETSPLTVPYPYRHLEGAHPEPDYDKKDVESALQHTPCTILRLPAVYGHGDPRRRFGAIIDALDRGEHLPHEDGATWRWTRAHVEDVGLAIALAAEHVSNFRIFNVGDDAPTMHTWAERFAAHMQIKLWWEHVDEVPDGLEHLGAMKNDVVVSSAAIRDALGWSETTTVDQRTADIVAWARESRP